MPTPSTGKSDFFLGTWNALTDSFTQLLDLNDQATFYIMNGGLDMPQPDKTLVQAGNLHAPGASVPLWNYKERHITVKLGIRGASASAVMASLRTLLDIIENPPYCIKLSWPGASQWSYADVIIASKVTVPTDPQRLLALAATGLTVDFFCATGLRGDRVVLQNLAYNPGFSAPSGPAAPLFNDPLANANAYSSQAGSAPTAGSILTTFSDIVMALSGTPSRYYEFGEPSGTTAYDSSGNAQNATYTSCTLGTSSLAAGNNGDKAVTLNGTTSLITLGTSGLPTANGVWSIACLVQIAGAPAATASVWSMGSTSGTRTGIWCQISTGRVVQVATAGGGIINTGATISTGAPHLIVVTWDGTTVRLYVDNNAAVTSTPGALAITYTSGGFLWGANFNTGTPSQFYPGILDEGALWVGTTLTSGNVTTMYNAAISNTGYVNVNTVLSIASGARAAFGSSAWSAYNAWQFRFRWVSGLTLNTYLHYTDASNYLRVQMTFNTLVLTQNVAGVSSTLASVTITQAMSPNFWYWLRITQFPQPYQAPGSQLNPFLTVTILSDTAGVIGSQYSNATTGTAPAFASTSVGLLGKPQLEASGATALIGGNNTTSQFLVQTFGPGAWTFNGNTGGSATGQASGAWELDTTKTYPNGPITSVGAARIDAAPAGTLDADWRSYVSGSLVGSYACPVNTAGDVMGLSVAIKSSGLGGSATIRYQIKAYQANGTLLDTHDCITTNAAGTGSWTAFTGTYTTPANTAYVVPVLRATDATTGSVNGSVWFDNVQLWDQTSTGMATMPYCELNFPQAPAQLLVSGILGDMQAPAYVAMGTYMATYSGGDAVTFALGRRSTTSSGADLVGNAFPDYNGAVVYDTPVVSSTSWGGWYTVNGSNASVTPVTKAHLTSIMAGTYHLYCLGYSARAAGTVVNVTVRAQGNLQTSPDSWLVLGTIFNDPKSTWYSPTTTPLSAQNTWTLADAGQVILPPFATGGLTDPSENNAKVLSEWNDVNGSGTALRVGWNALIPVDTQTLLGSVQNSLSSITTLANPGYLFIYADGLVVNQGGSNTAAGWNMSLESTSIPNPGHAAGNTGIVSGETQVQYINAVSDPYMRLDPNLDSGTNANQLGVNQFGAFMVNTGSNNPGQVQSLITEIRYTPLYLSPRQ